MDRMHSEAWAKLVIDQLILQGVCYFCLSPGSRSSALALAIAEHPKAQAMIHFDERGMAFHALGYAKGSNKPAVILCTTGTAAGNLFPAVMEASEARIPLIILTADRPPELRSCGSNQTADHVKFFGSYVRWQFDLPCSDEKLPATFIASTVAQGVFRSKHPIAGPVHLNCMFREPLVSPSHIPFPSCQHTQYERGELQPPFTFVESLAERFQEIEKGVVIVGAARRISSMDPIFAVADQLKWPVLSDVLSPARSKSLPYHDLILKTTEELEIDAVLHLGDRFVSKVLLEKLSPKLYCLVADHPERHDPKHQLTHRIECEPSLFCQALLPHLASNFDGSWKKKWHLRAEEIEKELFSFFEEEKNLSEPLVMDELASSFPSNWNLFLGNSMPIRDADNFFHPKENCLIFANRGISGIDGNIATAIGLSCGTKQTTVAVIGDLAALHDLSSLAQLKKSRYPVMIIVLNNGGGGIFSFLPVAQKQAAFEEFIATAHPYSLKSAAELFDLPYFAPTDRISLAECLKKETSCLIEVFTNRQDNFALHQNVLNRLATYAQK